MILFEKRSNWHVHAEAPSPDDTPRPCWNGSIDNISWDTNGVDRDNFPHLPARWVSQPKGTWASAMDDKRIQDRNGRAGADSEPIGNVWLPSGKRPAVAPSGRAAHSGA